jgi:hypothetical protein
MKGAAQVEANETYLIYLLLFLHDFKICLVRSGGDGGFVGVNNQLRISGDDGFVGINNQLAW